MANEKRLIDVNRVINEMQKCIDESPYERNSVAVLAFSSIIECLKQEPTVDAVEVVRCKDCVWFNQPGCAIYIVDDTDKPKETDFFSFGERRTDNGK